MNKKRVTRRKAMQKAGTIGATTAWGTSILPFYSRADSRTTTAFALIGDRYHNSHYIRTALMKTLVEKAGLSIDFTDDVTRLSTETLKHYKMLIVFRDRGVYPDGYTTPFPGYDPETTEMIADPPLQFEITNERKSWITPAQGRAVKEFVENGGTGFFYHNTSAISLENKDFRDVEGAIYTGHPPIRPFKVKITNKNHPITRGVNDFIVTDEQHYVHYDKSSEYVFMKNENLDGLAYADQGISCEAGWAYDYGKGRVCFMSPGHMIINLWNPEYVKLQRNAVKWLLKEI